MFNLSFRQYQKKSSSTAIYPKDKKVIYPLLGLSGEVGECSEKFKKIIRDTEKNLTELDEETKIEIEKELGDVLWYLSALASDLGLTLESIADKNLKKLNSRKKRGVLGGSGDNR